MQRLVEGTLVLGQVCQINPQDIAVALPNNLMGYAHLTRISGPLTKTVESIIDEDNHSEDKDDRTIPSPKDLFMLGQWVRVAVIENTVVSGASDKLSKKKHVELSLEPELVNAPLSPDDILSGTLVQVSVSSIEDHGLIVSLGLPGLTGFVKLASLGSYNVDDIKEGQVFLASVERTPTNNVVQLSLDLKASQKVIDDVSDIRSLLPGDKVRCLVSEVRAAGIGGKVLGMLNAIIDQFHLGGADIQENSNVILFIISLIQAHCTDNCFLSFRGYPQGLVVNSATYSGA